MRPSLDNFPSSPSSAWSCTDSRSPSTPAQDLTPPTPDSCFSPDEFSLQIGLQLDSVVGESPHRPTIPRSLPPKANPCFVSEDDTSNLRVLMRGGTQWENMHGRFESSPPRRHNAYRVPPQSQDAASDGFSWEASHSALRDPNELLDTSRCSILIREVSLLVGLTGEDDHLLPSGDLSPVSDESTQTSDILPLGLTPTKSLASRKRRSAGLPRPTFANSSPYADNVNNLTLRGEKTPPVTSSDLVVPIARHKSVDAIRPSITARRRQGQLFDFEPSLTNASCRNALHLDETFTHPRKAPPKPSSNVASNRCSSLDRLESSLRKLETYAPTNHRKSQSEGQSSKQRKDKRPSLPPPRRLRKQPSTQEVIHRNLSHPTHAHHFSGVAPSLSRPIPHQLVIPRTCPAVALDKVHHEGDVTPGSFMDMDIPRAEEARQTSSRQATNKRKIKGLVHAAKRVSRGVIAWGKNLTGSTKPSVAVKETVPV